MFSRAVHGWRAVQRSLVQELRNSVQRGFSDVSSNSGGPASRLSQLQAESPQASKIFGNVGLPAEAEPAASAAAQSAEAAGDALENTAVGRVFSAIGNTLFFGGLGAAGFFGYYTYRYDADQVAHMVEETKKEENSFPGSKQLWVPVMEWYVEKRKYMESEWKKYADPPSDKLLPDLPPQVQHVKTLVLDLDDVLVHSDWSRERGWRTFKRPGADAFIADMAQYYELVVYTSQLPTYADPILDRLDPQRMIQYRLYRDSTQYQNGRHVRDLSKLNRDMSKVLFVTADKDACALQPENAIKIKPWKLENDDTQLLDLLPVLEAVVRTNVPDVRAVVRSYEGQDIVAAFRERMKRIQEEKAQKQQAHRSLLSGITRK